MGADIDVVNANRDSALHVAARVGFAWVISRLLEKCPKTNERNGEGFSPLGLAIQGKHTDIVREFIERRVLLRECLREHFYGKSEAYTRQCLATFQELLDQKMVGGCEESYLAMAVLAGDEGTACRLLMPGRWRNKDGESLLHLAVITHKQHIVGLLFEKGIQVD